MKIHIARATLFLFCLVQLSCSASSSEEQKIQKLNSVETFSDLSDLKDEDSVVMAKIREIEDSNDPALDQENKVEVMNAQDKILIVGDSWGSFPCLYHSMSKMIKDVNAKIIEDTRCLRTTKLGVEASEWMGSKQDQRVVRFLKNTPRIKYLYLSLGGNDMMRHWNKDFTPEQENKLFSQTFNTIQKIMNNYLNARPDLKIILSGYDFPHFKPNHKIGLYRKIFERMGSPTDQRINRCLVDFAKFMVPISNQNNIFYIHHLGLAQYYDGVVEQNYPARGTVAPNLISPIDDPGAIGGDLNLPSSETSMINWLFLVHDAFHLNARMYRNVMNHTYDNVLSRIIQ
ncbi:MAG: hypothetical protein H7Z71_04760 [Moraxellaceae bacterium]|nr:hypothetical protein [Pseudobdellovibrionaceae bacterium]